MRITTASVSAGLRVEIHSPELAAVPTLQNEFELMQQQIRTAGRITPGVYATVQKLSHMVATIIEPSILEAHASDQMLVDLLFSEITMCDATYSKFTMGKRKQSLAELAAEALEVKKSEDALAFKKQQYTKCLDDRDFLVARNSTVCCQATLACPGDGYGDCDRVKLSEGFVGCDYKANTGEECFKNAKALVSPLEGYFAKNHMTYIRLQSECTNFDTALKAKFSECNYLLEAVNSHVNDINGVGSQVGNHSSDVAAEIIIQCASYDECHANTTAAYNKTVGPCARDQKEGEYGVDQGACVMAREHDRKQEWDSTQIIKCMLDHYCAGGNFEEQLLEECKKSITNYHLAIRYPEVLPPLDCDDGVFPDVLPADSCVDRPYDQFLGPCESLPLESAPMCVESGECPDWCPGAGGA